MKFFRLKSTGYSQVFLNFGFFIIGDTEYLLHAVAFAVYNVMQKSLEKQVVVL